MRAVFILATALLLAGCVNTARVEREAYLTQFVGQPEDELVRQMGVPTRTLETGGRKFLAYVQARMELYRPTPMFGAFGGGGIGYMGSIRPTEMTERFCETTFELANGKVAGVRMHGNDCG